MTGQIKKNLVGSLIRILNIFGVTKADVNDICNQIMVEYVEYFEMPGEVGK
jgi:hypothetical protein